MMPTFCARADSVVVFNEIMYHPLVSEATMEWVELHNQMAVDVDLSGWYISGGADFAFAEGTVISGGGYLVVAASPAALADATGLTNVLGPLDGRLSNDGEKLELRNRNHRLMDSVRYGVDGDWPVGPDGSGVSLAKRGENTASARAESWAASALADGTPGEGNFTTSPVEITTTALLLIDGDWKYEASGTDLGTFWREAGFDDSAWPSGQALFRAGNVTVETGDPEAVTTLFSLSLIHI